METKRDLSFDYAERVQGDKCGEFEYSRTPAVPSTPLGAPGGDHYHFWVPRDMISQERKFPPGWRQTKLAEALADAKKRFKVASTSWGFIPVTAEHNLQHKELFLIDWRQSRKTKATAGEHFKRHPLAQLIPDLDFEVVKMINTAEWTCGAGLTETEVNLLLIRGDITVHIQHPLPVMSPWYHGKEAK